MKMTKKNGTTHYPRNKWGRQTPMDRAWWKVTEQMSLVQKFLCENPDIDYDDVFVILGGNSFTPSMKKAVMHYMHYGHWYQTSDGSTYFCPPDSGWTPIDEFLKNGWNTSVPLCNVHGEVVAHYSYH